MFWLHCIDKEYTFLDSSFYTSLRMLSVVDASRKNLKEKDLFICILQLLAQDYFFLRPLLVTVGSELGRLI